MMSALKQYASQRSVLRDLVRAYRLRRGQPQWKGLRAPEMEGEPTKQVLLATGGGGYLAGTRVESLLAMALAERGAKAHVLLCDGVMPACLECNSDWYPNARAFAAGGPTGRHCRWCFEPASKMYRDVGIEVHRYSDLLTAEEVDHASEAARVTSGTEVGDYVLGDVPLGEHALAGALRFFACGSLPDGPDAEAIVKRYLNAALLTYFATSRLVEAEQLDVAVFHHGIYVPQGIIGEVCRRRRIRVVNWHVAYRKNTFIFSHNDTYHHTLIDEPTANWESMTWSDETDAALTKYLRSRWFGTEDWVVFHQQPELGKRELVEQTGLDPSKPWIGMLTNVVWDAQLHYPANAFPSMLDWAVATVEYFRAHPELELLIRVHPAEVSGTLRSKEPFLTALGLRVAELPRNVHVIPPQSALSTYEAMERCNAVLIYGTKTGVELAAVGVPVVVAGEAWIRKKGITLDATSEDDYLQILDRLPLQEAVSPDVVQRARKYAYHFFFRRMIPLSMARSVPGAPGFEFDVGEVFDLSQGRDLGLDVICDGILLGAEFIYPAERLEAAPAV